MALSRVGPEGLYRFLYFRMVCIDQGSVVAFLDLLWAWQRPSHLAPYEAPILSSVLRDIRI